AESQAIAARLLAGSAVHRSDRPAQDAAERVSRSVKIREVHHVKEGNSRLQLKVLPVFIDPAEVDIECPQPAHPGFVVGRGRHYLLYSLQRRQLSLGEQSAVDQNVSSGSWLTGKVVVVVVDHAVDVIAFVAAVIVGDVVAIVAGDPVSKRTNVGAGKHIAKTAVRGKAAVAGAITRDVGHEDAARVSGRVQRKRHRERTIKMSDRAHAKVQRQIHGATERYLVLAVEAVRAQIMLRAVEVGGDVDEVVVGCRGDIALELIRDLQVKVSHPGKRMIQMLLQRQLQGSIPRIADGEQHLVGAEILINSGEGCSRAGTSTRSEERRVGK